MPGRGTDAQIIMTLRLLPTLWAITSSPRQQGMKARVGAALIVTFFLHIFHYIRELTVGEHYSTYSRVFLVRVYDPLKLNYNSNQILNIAMQL